ncbi:CobW/HypB/UreG nucleotide-binding domain-containing protein [Plasmodiophora brassicae]
MASVDAHVPVIIVTGFLGAGKTTLIRSITSQLQAGNPGYKSVWLKNEFGDQAVDTALAGSSVSVKEIVNGCLCCQLVGQMADALGELVASRPAPEHIFIETSGSAYPAPLVLEVQRLQGQGCRLKISSVVCVIDCENFPGYKDTSITAKLQAKFTDLILLNKHENISEDHLDKVVDQVVGLNPDTPRLKTARGAVNAELLLDFTHREEMDRLMASDPVVSNPHHHSNEVEVLSVQRPRAEPFLENEITEFLGNLSRDTFYRVKGFVWTTEGPRLLNFAFGRWELIPLTADDRAVPPVSKLTIMGSGIRFRTGSIRDALRVADDAITLIQ